MQGNFDVGVLIGWWASWITLVNNWDGYLITSKWNITVLFLFVHGHSVWFLWGTNWLSSLRQIGCCDNIVTMLGKCCGNLALNVVPTLFSRYFTTFQQHCQGVQAMLCECCHCLVWTLYWCCAKVVPTLYQCCANVDAQHGNHTKLQCLHNVVQTLWQCWSPTLGTDIETRFRQCCVNIVAMPLPNVRRGGGMMLWQHSGNVVWEILWHCCSPMLVTDFETMFRQHCVNISSKVTPNIGDWHHDNVQVML